MQICKYLVYNIIAKFRFIITIYLLIIMKSNKKYLKLLLLLFTHSSCDVKLIFLIDYIPGMYLMTAIVVLCI